MAALKQVFCLFRKRKSELFKKSLRTCLVDQTIESGYDFGLELDATNEAVHISNRKVKFLPRNVGEKFPNLVKFEARKCGLTVLRDHYFKSMGNLQYMALNDNKIKTIDSKVFTDLIKLEYLVLNTNLIETLDEKLFIKMVNLKKILLNNNKVKFLSPTTFSIPKGKLWYVDLKGNVCSDKIYGSKSFGQLEGDIRAKCK